MLYEVLRGAVTEYDMYADSSSHHDLLLFCIKGWDIDLIRLLVRRFDIQCSTTQRGESMPIAVQSWTKYYTPCYDWPSTYEEYRVWCEGLKGGEETNYVEYFARMIDVCINGLESCQESSVST